MSRLFQGVLYFSVKLVHGGPVNVIECKPIRKHSFPCPRFIETLQDGIKFPENLLCPILCKSDEKRGIIWQCGVQAVSKVWLSLRQFQENHCFTSQFCENSYEEFNEERRDCLVANITSQTVMWRTDVISTRTHFVKNGCYSRCCVSLRHIGLVLSVTLRLNFVTDSDVYDPRPKVSPFCSVRRRLKSAQAVCLQLC